MEILQPGSKSQADKKDVERELFCDDQGSGNITRFYRNFVYNSDGTLDSTFDTDLAGGAYTVVGTAAPCDEAKKQETVTGRESLAITDASAVSLTVPANTEYAIIQVIGADEIYYTIDGATTPLNDGSLGFLQNDCAIFKIGCDPDSGGVSAALADFEAIAGSGFSGRLEVSYFGCL